MDFHLQTRDAFRLKAVLDADFKASGKCNMELLYLPAVLLGRTLYDSVSLGLRKRAKRCLLDIFSELLWLYSLDTLHHSWFLLWNQ